MVSARRIRRSAQAVLLSDLQLLNLTGNPDREDDLKRWPASWTTEVSYDEVALCEAKKPKNVEPRQRTS